MRIYEGRISNRVKCSGDKCLRWEFAIIFGEDNSLPVLSFKTGSEGQFPADTSGSALSKAKCEHFGFTYTLKLLHLFAVNSPLIIDFPLDNGRQRCHTVLNYKHMEKNARDFATFKTASQGASPCVKTNKFSSRFG